MPTTTFVQGDAVMCRPAGQHPQLAAMISWVEGSPHCIVQLSKPFIVDTVDADTTTEAGCRGDALRRLYNRNGRDPLKKLQKHTNVTGEELIDMWKGGLIEATLADAPRELDALMSMRGDHELITIHLTVTGRSLARWITR
jgi:hypothetical protein